MTDIIQTCTFGSTYSWGHVHTVLIYWYSPYSLLYPHDLGELIKLTQFSHTCISIKVYCKLTIPTICAQPDISTPSWSTFYHDPCSIHHHHILPHNLVAVTVMLPLSGYRQCNFGVILMLLYGLKHLNLSPFYWLFHISFYTLLITYSDSTYIDPM